MKIYFKRHVIITIHLDQMPPSNNTRKIHHTSIYTHDDKNCLENIIPLLPRESLLVQLMNTIGDVGLLLLKHGVLTACRPSWPMQFCLHNYSS